MAVQAGFSRIAALLADPAREAMLVALADGRALPAGELAKAAGITPQSASGHLRKMIEGGIVSVWSQGRFRYYRLASESVPPWKPLPPSPKPNHAASPPSGTCRRICKRHGVATRTLRDALAWRWRTRLSDAASSRSRAIASY
jgi:DNA-binding transcriptional ArsR family regulator